MTLLMTLFIICLLSCIARFERKTSYFLALFWGGGGFLYVVGVFLNCTEYKKGGEVGPD